MNILSALTHKVRKWNRKRKILSRWGDDLCCIGQGHYIQASNSTPNQDYESVRREFWRITACISFIDKWIAALHRTCTTNERVEYFNDMRELDRILMEKENGIN